MDREPLHYDELQGKTRLYEYEHVTDKTYPGYWVIPVGSHTNMFLCKHCWFHLKGLVTTEIVREETSEAVREMVRRTWREKRESLQAQEGQDDS